MCTLPFPNLPINLCFFLPPWSHSSLRSCETEVRSCHCPALPLQGLLILLRAKASISVVHSEALHLDTGSSPLSSFPFSPYLTKNTLKKRIHSCLRAVALVSAWKALPPTTPAPHTCGASYRLFPTLPHTVPVQQSLTP